MYLFTYLFIDLLIYLFIYVFVYLFIYLLIYLTYIYIHSCTTAPALHGTFSLKSRANCFGKRLMPCLGHCNGIILAFFQGGQKGEGGGSRNAASGP